MNNGLEELGKHIVDENTRPECCGVFSFSGVESVQLPFTLKRLKNNTFSSCRNLKNIQLPNRLEYIEDRCFSGSGVEELMLPRSLKKIGYNALESCGSLRTVYVEDGCEVSLSCVYIANTTAVLPLSKPTIGGVNIQELRS